MCLFYLILRGDVLMFRIPGISQCVNNYFETPGEKLNLLNELISQTFFLLGLLNSR